MLILDGRSKSPPSCIPINISIWEAGNFFCQLQTWNEVIYTVPVILWQWQLRFFFVLFFFLSCYHFGDFNEYSCLFFIIIFFLQWVGLPGWASQPVGQLSGGDTKGIWCCWHHHCFTSGHQLKVTLDNLWWNKRASSNFLSYLLSFPGCNQKWHTGAEGGTDFLLYFSSISAWSGSRQWSQLAEGLLS